MGTESILIPGPRPEASEAKDTRRGAVCTAEDDDCELKEDGVCDYVYCGCDYTDCGGSAMPYDYGPTSWTWKMSTVRAWGEDPDGNWTLTISDKNHGNTAQSTVVNAWSLFGYGHTRPPPPPPNPPSIPPFPAHPSIPPAAPGSTVVGVPKLRVEMVASGDISTYTEATRRSIGQLVARKVGVAADHVTVTISAASVRIVCDVRCADDSCGGIVASLPYHWTLDPGPWISCPYSQTHQSTWAPCATLITHQPGPYLTPLPGSCRLSGPLGFALVHMCVCMGACIHASMHTHM